MGSNVSLFTRGDTPLRSFEVRGRASPVHGRAEPHLAPRWS